MVEDGELAVVKERKRRKVNCSQDDVLRMQHKCLSLTRENLSLKKKKARTSSASFAAPG